MSYQPADLLDSLYATFKNMVAHSPVAMCVLRGEKMVIEIANERICEIWGRRYEEVINKPVFEALPEARGQGLEEMLLKVYQTGERITANERAVELLRDGKPTKVYINFVYDAMRSTEGSIIGVTAVAIDVTEQVEMRREIEAAEERARLAVEAADMGTYDLYMQTNKLITSPRFDEIFGLRGDANVPDYIAVIHPEDMPIRDAAHQTAINTGKLFYVVRLLRPDGTIRWIQAEGTMFYDAEKKPLRLLGTLRDITEQKEIQQQKDDFIGIASHELKTPLTSLKASFQFLQRLIKTDPSSSAVESLVNRSLSSLNRLNRLVGDLLDVSKINEGYLALNKKNIVIADITESCCSHVRMEGKHEIKVTGNPALAVNADPERIEQVLANLVNNAVKYAPDSSMIEVHIEQVHKAVKVSVKDQGCGIPDENIPLLFKRYYRVEATNNFSGLGLGLYISSEIIKRHGGHIGVESKVGEGSTFWFTLPSDRRTDPV